MLCAALVMVVGYARPADAQWPTVIMFYGDPLEQPVFVTGGDTPPFGVFVRAPRNQAVTAKDMGDRPYVSVAFFWGPADQPAMNGVRTLTGLKPEMTMHHGRLYPADAGRPTMMFMSGLGQVKGRGKVFPGQAAFPLPTDPAAFTVGGEVPAPALAVLKRLGVIAQTRR
jgi:hypothetical protein